MSIVLNYAIVRELGITSTGVLGAYFDREAKWVPTNKYLKPILADYHRREREKQHRG